MLIPTLRYLLSMWQPLCCGMAMRVPSLWARPFIFSQQNAERTSFDDESMDLVVSHIMLHETSHKAFNNILKESLRLLRPGGIMMHMEQPEDSQFEDRFDSFFVGLGRSQQQ